MRQTFKEKVAWAWIKDLRWRVSGPGAWQQRWTGLRPPSHSCKCSSSLHFFWSKSTWVSASGLANTATLSTAARQQASWNCRKTKNRNCPDHSDRPQNEKNLLHKKWRELSKLWTSFTLTFAFKWHKRGLGVDKAPRLSISIVIWILSSDTETSAATPLGAVLAK